MPTLLLPFFILLCVGISILFWMGIVVAFGRLGKWHKLAAVYAAPLDSQIPLDAEKKMITFLRMGLTQYKGVVRIFATSQGIFLRPIFIFKFRHPMLFIPWRDVEGQENQTGDTASLGGGFKENLSFLWGSDKFIFRNASDIKVSVDKTTGAFIREKKKQFHF